MAEATLDAPLDLDPRTAAKLRIRSFQADCDGRVVTIIYDLVDSDGKVVDRRQRVATGSQVQTWITNQEATIYTRLLAELGVTGTVG